MFSSDPKGAVYRTVVIVAGLSMIGLGLTPILGREVWLYANWFGGLVFAPLAVLFGLLMIFFAVWKPQWLGAPTGSKDIVNRRRPSPLSRRQ